MRRRHRHSVQAPPMSQINITNLVDVTMVTLIIYMIIAPMVEHGIDVKLPYSSPMKMAASTTATVSLSRKGGLYLNNVRVTRNQLRDRLKTMAATKPDLPLVIRADDDLPYRDIIDIMDMARTGGLTNLGLATRVGK